MTKRLSLEKFFSWFTFVELSVMYFYLLFRCKKMIAFHSCPRDILVTSKRILREKKVNLQMHFLGQAKFMFVSSVDPILSWKTGQGRLRICNFSWDYLKYLLDYLSEIDVLFSWFTFWSENDKIEVQGVSYWNGWNYLTLRGRRINNFVVLWFLVASGDLDICVLSTSFKKVT